VALVVKDFADVCTVISVTCASESGYVSLDAAAKVSGARWIYYSLDRQNSDDEYSKPKRRDETKTNNKIKLRLIIKASSEK